MPQTPPAAVTQPAAATPDVGASAAPAETPQPDPQSVYCRTCDRLVVAPPGAQHCPACGLPFASEYQAGLPANLGRLVDRSGLVTLMAGGIALAASVALFFALRPLANPGSWVERLLYPTGGQWQIPWATVLVFLWGLLLLAMRLQSIKVERRAPDLPCAKQIASDVRSQNVERAAQQLQRIGDQRPIGLYLHRVLRAVTEWDRTRDGAAVHRALSDQASLDVDTLQSSINIVRVFIWAAPILGFIGTVLGISMGVDQFSNALLGAAAEQLQMGTVQQALVKVASSLAFAFNTTLLGLVAALMMMIAYTAVQRIEDELLDHVYDQVNARVVTLLKAELPGGLSEAEIAVAKEVAEAIRDAVGGLAARADGLEREAQLLDAAAGSLRSMAEQNQGAWADLRAALGALEAHGRQQAEIANRPNESSVAWPQDLQRAAETIGNSL